MELILAEENGEDTYGTDSDSMLQAISQEVDFGEVDPDAIDGQIQEHRDIWSVNGDWEPDVFDASREEIESAIQAVFGISENGS